MAEEIRCYVMRKMSQNKMKLDGRAGPLCPWQQSRLEKEKIASHNWTPIWSGDNARQMYQIENNCRIKVDVDIFKQTCTCRFWQLIGMSCMHACSTLALRGFKPEDHCHAWLTLGSYRATYSYFIQPVNSQIYWEPTPYEKLVPPKVKRSAGRPKKNRRKDGNEEPIGGSSMKKTYNDTQCGRCGLMGHNSRSCAKQGVARRPKNWIDLEPEEQVPSNVASVETVVENVATEVQQENVATDVVQENVAADNGPVPDALSRQVMSTRRYGMRRPVISTDMHKQTPVRGPAPQNPSAHGVIRVPNPNYGPSASNQPQYMEFIPTPEFPKH